MLRTTLPLVLVALAAGCDNPPPAPVDAASGDAAADVGPTDAGPMPTCDTPPPPFAHGGDGHASPLGASATEARAGRLTAAMLPASATGLATWSAGDFVLANDRVALLVEDVGVSDLYDTWGGRPVGVARVEGGALVDAADFNELLMGLATFQPETDHVGVIADGSAGGPAVIRASGPLHAIDFAGDILSAITSRSDVFEDWQVAIDYSLAPGADAVEVSVHVLQPDGVERRASRMLLGVFQQSRMPTLAPGGGGFASRSGMLPYLAYDDIHGNAAWGWRAPAGRSLAVLIEISGVQVISMGPATLPACSQVDIPIGSLVIGRDLPAVVASMARAEGTPLRALRGRVTEADGTTPAADARVHVEVGGTYLTRAQVAADGTFSMEIPAAGSARVRAYRRGFATADVDVPAGDPASANVSLPAYGTIHVLATEGGMPLPVRVQVLPSSGSPAPVPATFGEVAVTTGRTHVDFALDGESTLRVPAGSWRVVVSRGYEYELDDRTVTVAAGATVEVAADMQHSVDTTGRLCADYHVHTTRSPDSEDDGADKVTALVADGLEIAVRSDHQYVADFGEVVTALGVSAWALGISGLELTTFEWGHFGVFPLIPDPSRPSAGAIPWVGRTPPPVFAEVRARPEDPALIINHPRINALGFGYFAIAGYDPVTGMADRPDFWDEDFQVIELANDSSFESNRTTTVPDWFSFLRMGRHVWAVGSSDSHHLYEAPTGYPRTCLALGTDDPRMVDANDVRDATNAGHAVISGGVYMDVTTMGGAGPGDTVAGAAAMETVHVVVRAAEWVEVRSLEVIVDGATTSTLTLPGPRTEVDPTIVFDEMIDVPVAVGTLGSWVVFHASGETAMDDLHPGRMPFAVSNPIFFTR